MAANIRRPEESFPRTDAKEWKNTILRIITERAQGWRQTNSSHLTFGCGVTRSGRRDGSADAALLCASAGNVYHRFAVAMQGIEHRATEGAHVGVARLTHAAPLKFCFRLLELPLLEKPASQQQATGDEGRLGRDGGARTLPRLFLFVVLHEGLVELAHARSYDRWIALFESELPRLGQ